MTTIPKNTLTLTTTQLYCYILLKESRTDFTIYVLYASCVVRWTQRILSTSIISVACTHAKATHTLSSRLFLSAVMRMKTYELTEGLIITPYFCF